MGFMQRDVDFKLILLILVVIIAIVGLTLFYQSSAGNIVTKYNKVTEKLEHTHENLTITEVKLGSCIDDLANATAELEASVTYQLDAQDEFNAIYEEQEDTLEQTETSLRNKESELEDTQSDLEDAENNLATCEAEKVAYQEDAQSADKYAQDAKEALDGCTCDSVEACQACMDDALDEINNVRNYLDEIE